MDDHQISEIVTQIEASTSREGAFLKFPLMSMGTGMDANRAGYLRMALLLLKCAVAPYKGDGPSLDVNPDVFDEDCKTNIKQINRDETLENYNPMREDNAPRPLSARLHSFGCASIFYFSLALMLLGIATILQWLSRLLSTIGQ